MTTAASPPDGSVDHEDDDALRWGDADDATHVDAAHNPVAVKERRPRDDEGPMGSGPLIGFGVLGGLYLLYTVAWLISASVLAVADPASEVMRALAIVAPALWFVATLWLGQSARSFG